MGDSNWPPFTNDTASDGTVAVPTPLLTPQINPGDNQRAIAEVERYAKQLAAENRMSMLDAENGLYSVHEISNGFLLIKRGAPRLGYSEQNEITYCKDYTAVGEAMTANAARQRLGVEETEPAQASFEF